MSPPWHSRRSSASAQGYNGGLWEKQPWEGAVSVGSRSQRCEGSDEAHSTEWGSPLTRQEAYGESSVSVVSLFPLVTKDSEGGRGHEVRSSNPHAVPTVFSLLDQKTRNEH